MSSYKCGNDPDAHGINKFFLSTSIDRKTGAVAHRLRVANYYTSWESGGSWRTWNRAASDAAVELALADVVRREHPTTSALRLRYQEDFSVVIPAETLDFGAAKDIGIKLWAANGQEMLLSLPTATVRRHMEDVRRAAALMGTAPAG